MPSLPRLPLWTVVPILLLHGVAQGQIVVQPDGKLRSIFGISTTVVTGNTKSTSVSVNGEAIRLTDHSKWTMLGRALYAESQNNVTAASLAASTQFDRDFTTKLFGFGKLDYLRDKPANLLSRLSAYGGVGRHLRRDARHTWDAIVGLGYTDDRYVQPALISGESLSRYGRTELLLSENSNHKLTPTTVLRQKVEVYPNLREKGEYRWVLDAGLSVAMTQSVSLTAGLIYRHNSDPGNGVRSGDAMLLTGIAIRMN